MIKKTLANICLCIFLIVCIVTITIDYDKIDFTDVKRTKIYNAIYNDLNTDVIIDSVTLINKRILTFDTTATLTLVEEQECINDKDIQYIKEDKYMFYIYTTKKYNKNEFCCYIYTTYIVEKL